MTDPKVTEAPKPMRDPDPRATSPFAAKATRRLMLGLTLGLTLCLGGLAAAGGSPENILLIIDPTSPESLYVGNYYRQARGIPDANVVYMAPAAPDFPTFADRNLDALFGTLAERGIGDHIDYIVVTSGSPFYMTVPAGLITDGCSAVRRFSISGAWTLSHAAPDVLLGGPSTEVNRFFRNSNTPVSFDSETRWLNGLPTTSTAGERYFIGAMLGYTGALGNTVAETIAMIDRSVAVDGTRPVGTFYYMQTTDPARSGPRHGQYPVMVAAISGLGGMAQHLMAVLPVGQHDCLGIMTGWASPGIVPANMTILPGAFCDHLTSYAGRLDSASQEKLSQWIKKGASGSWGTVEEPCNYPGKFPHPRMHVLYYQGMSLGEATFRSIGYRPYQGLLYGDPMTRPFAYLPTVKLAGAPPAVASGRVRLQPAARTLNPSAAIAGHELLVDGQLHHGTPAARKLAGFEVDTTVLADGWHDLRILGYDDSDARSVGRWMGELVTDNRGRSASLSVLPVSGDRSTQFTFDVAGAGGAVSEVRLVLGGRVVAAAPGGMAALQVFGQTLGAGPARVQAEALFADGERVRSAPITIDVADASSAPAGVPPVAFSFTRFVRADRSFVVELPVTSDEAVDSLGFALASSPAQADVPAGQSGAFRLVRPLPGASGSDTFDFTVTSPGGMSNLATVTIVYEPDPGTLPFLHEVSGGAVASGGLGELFADDDERVVVDGRGFAAAGSSATVTTLVRGTCPVALPGEIRVLLEAHSTSPALQRIELWNDVSRSWEQVDERPAPMSETLTTVTITATPTRFVDAYRQLRARARFVDTTGMPLGWSVEIDQLRWEVME